MASDLSDFSMLDLFRTEAETNVRILSDGLLALEQQPSALEQVEPLMRAAHSLKGAARIVHLDAVVELAHAMEDCFVAAQGGNCVLDSGHIDLLLKGTDCFNAIANTAEQNIPAMLEARRAELSELAAAIKTIGAGGAAGPAVPKEAARAASPSAGGAADEAAPGVSAQEPPEGIVRVTADTLSRLMGLAGEFLVEARWFRPFSDTLQQTKKRQDELYDLLSSLRLALEGTMDERCESYLLESRQKLYAVTERFSQHINDFEIFARRSARLSSRLHQEILHSRMRPFADGVQGFPRLVRDLAKKLNKKAKLEINGMTTRVDRDILEKLEAPLNHLLRNCIDHGIEAPDVREACCKNPEGTIVLEARHRAGMLLISVSDDGRGVCRDALRGTVVDRGLASPELAAGLTDAELLEFLFLPGFSTAAEVTEISGRGVGLDVVQNMVRAVGGNVRASSETGRSMTFHLQLPLTLSVIRTLLVQIGGESYAVPLSRIEYCRQVPQDEVKLLEGRHYALINKQHIGLVDACQVLGYRPVGRGDILPVVILSEQLSTYGLVVDRFLGERDLVVQPLDARLGKVQDVTAAALMIDGSPVLILDVDDLLRSIEKQLSESQLKRIATADGDGAQQGPQRVLVVDDSLTVRETERKLLENSGYAVDVAVNGVDGWNAVHGGGYDLVITDIDMPRMNGFELTRLIKQDADLKATPVIIVSYKEREEDRVKGLETGANYYLTKSSFQNEAFVSAVKDLIGSARV